MPRTNLFTVRTIREDPANLNSADAELIVTGDDSMDYVVKTTHKHPGLPASEWLGHHLADAAGIPTPQYGVVELQDGRNGFGSQWDSSALTDPAMRIAIARGGPSLQHLAPLLSKIYTLDQFTYNVDRHLGNYFLVSTGRGVGVKAYDFSRSLLFHGWPPPPPPVPTGCNTHACFRALRVAYPYHAASGAETIRKLRGVRTTRIREWLDDMPSEWMTAARRAQVCDWWEDEAPGRLEIIRKGLANGTFL